MWGVYIPEEYGGLGGGIFEMALVVEQLSRACGGIALAFAGTGLGTFPITSFRQQRAEKANTFPILRPAKSLRLLASQKPMREATRPEFKPKLF